MNARLFIVASILLSLLLGQIVCRLPRRGRITKFNASIRRLKQTRSKLGN